SVEATKRELSTGRRATLLFEHEDLRIEAEVTREEFEGWIAEEIAAIAAAVDDLFRHAETAADRVDRVFLTGGSSFVPAVRRIFEERFGEERLRFGDEFTSVANGLALRALEEEC
ncbi:MAG: Hsp70 family protein, partial [Myxococcota bacterium]